MSPDLTDDHYCFACGSENELGLCIDWKGEGKKTFAEFIPEKKFQGWKGIVHGGILATLLDEAMTRLAWIACGGALTAEITVRYLKTASIGEKLLITGEIVEESRKLVLMKAAIHTAGSKELIARSTGKAVKI